MKYKSILRPSLGRKTMLHRPWKIARHGELDLAIREFNATEALAKIRFSRNMHTVGHVDGMLRSIWRHEVLKLASTDPKAFSKYMADNAYRAFPTTKRRRPLLGLLSRSDAGHRVDLIANEILTDFENNMGRTLIESYFGVAKGDDALGQETARKWILHLFVPQPKSANRSMGSFSATVARVAREEGWTHIDFDYE